MKISTLLLIGSLIANGVLLIALTLSSPSVKPTLVPGDAPAGNPTSAAAAALPDTPANAFHAIDAPRENLWSRLRTDDLDEFRNRLRAAGFPAREIRAMLSMAIDERMTAKREALVGKPEEIPYWRSPFRSTNNPKLQNQLSEIYREAETLNYKFVNGPDTLADDEEALESAKRRFGNLSLDKLQQLIALQHDFGDRQSQVLNNTIAQARAETNVAQIESGRALGNIEKAMRALGQEQQAAIGKLLTPEELEQYELRNNAGGLRMQLELFRPTEAEFKALYAIQRQMTELYGQATDDPAQRDAIYAAARQKYDAQALAVLGPERFADYQATRSFGDKVTRLVARLDLPLSTVSTINAVRDDINQRAASVRADSQLSAAQRDTQLATLAQEASEKLTATLGKRGYDAYNDMKGDWIRALQPKPTPSRP